MAQVRLDMASSHEHPPEQAQSHNEEKLMGKHPLLLLMGEGCVQSCSEWHQPWLPLSPLAC